MITYNKGRKTAILDDSAGQACICLQRYQHLDGRRSRDRNMAAPMKWERESSIGTGKVVLGGMKATFK